MSFKKILSSFLLTGHFLFHIKPYTGYKLICYIKGSNIEKGDTIGGATSVSETKMRFIRSTFI